MCLYMYIAYVYVYYVWKNIVPGYRIACDHESSLFCFLLCRESFCVFQCDSSQITTVCVIIVILRV